MRAFYKSFNSSTLIKSSSS